MSEKLAEALATKTYWQSGPMEMPSTHCVIMEQCYRHQGKANTLISGLNLHIAALAFEPWNRARRDRGHCDSISINY